MADEPYDEASMKAVARTARTLYLSLIEEGFTEAQSMELIKAVITRQRR